MHEGGGVRDERREGLYAFEEFEIDVARMELRRGGIAVAVQPRVLETLIHLIENRHRAVSKEELIDGPWRGAAVGDGALNQVVSLARVAVGDDGERQSIIKTVRGHGYRFVAPVRDAAPPAPRVVRAPSWFVGRDEERAEIRARFDAAVAGKGAVLLIEGEPGVGKSTLVERVAAELAPSGRVVWGRCVEGGGAAPFTPWLSALRALARPERVGREGAGELAPLFRLLPELSAGVDREAANEDPLPSEGPAVRSRVFEAALALVRGEAMRAPIVLILEDLHAADEPSLALLELFARSIGDVRVLIVGTFRDVEVATNAALRRQLEGPLGSAPRVRLAGLARAEAGRLLAALLATDAAAANVSSLYEVTSGNPFFIGEVARAAQREGGIAALAEALRAFRVPEHLTQTVRRGLATLPDPTRALLAAASVLGREFDLGVLHRVAETSPRDALERLGAAVGARWVRDVDADGFVFSHAVVRECLYEDLLPAERVRLHERAARALEERRRESIHLIAHHYFHAAPGGAVREALEYLRLAARDAHRRTAYEEAAAQLERALRVLAFDVEDAKTRVELLIDLGSALRCKGDQARARAAFDEALALARAEGDADLAARAVDAYAATQQELVDVALVERLREVLDDHPAGDSALRARVAARLARAGNFLPTVEAPDEIARSAAEMAERVSDPGALAVALLARLWTFRGFVPPSERLAIAERGIAAATRSGDREIACELRISKIDALLGLGRREALAVELPAMEAEARTLGNAWLLVIIMRFRVVRALFEGRYVEADALADRARAAGVRIADQVTEVVYWMEMTHLRREQGRIGELEPFVRGWTALVPQDTAWRSFLVLVLVETAREDEGREIFAALAKDDFAGIVRDMNWLATLTHLAEAAVLLGDVVRARALYELLMPHRDEHVVYAGGSLYRAPVQRYLAMLAAARGSAVEARAHYDEAIAACTDIGARAWKRKIEAERARLDRQVGER